MDNTSTQTTFFSDLPAALAHAAPEGATVFTVGFDGLDVLRAGYRAVDYPDDADIIAARGGEREFALAQSKIGQNQKLILVPTHAYFCAASGVYRATDGAFAKIKTGIKPCAAVFDPACADKNQASIFGEIAALDTDAFDLYFGARMCGERPPASVVQSVAALVTELTAELKAAEKDRPKISNILVEYGKRAARIAESEPRLLHCSGAAQMSEAVRMLYAAEERPLGMRGEIKMLLSSFVVDFYLKNVNDGGHANGVPEFPPDNGRRIDSLCEYFGADLRRACLYTSPVLPPVKMRLCEYRRDEFKSDIYARLTALKARQNSAFRVFKRLYPDDGYCIKTMIDRTDLGICLALAPDVFRTDSMLSFLKQAGKLDKYII